MGEVKGDRAEDLRLLREAERALAEIDRTQGLEDRHADVLAALRIRIEGGPRASLGELLDAAGAIEGKRAKQLDEQLAAPPKEEHKGDLSELIGDEPKKNRTLDDLLG